MQLIAGDGPRAHFAIAHEAREAATARDACNHGAVRVARAICRAGDGRATATAIASRACLSAAATGTGSAATLAAARVPACARSSAAPTRTRTGRPGAFAPSQALTLSSFTRSPAEQRARAGSPADMAAKITAAYCRRAEAARAVRAEQIRGGAAAGSAPNKDRSHEKSRLSKTFHSHAGSMADAQCWVHVALGQGYESTSSPCCNYVRQRKLLQSFRARKTSWTLRGVERPLLPPAASCQLLQSSRGGCAWGRNAMLTGLAWRVRRLGRTRTENKLEPSKRAISLRGTNRLLYRSRKGLSTTETELRSADLFWLPCIGPHIASRCVAASNLASPTATAQL